MREPREARSIIEAAEQAAAAGHYASAEELLREAALLQEATLGPLHPDLVNTLNNLGVVCEITGHPADAEHYFRRALTIATAVLEPDHPFVETSRQNLRDFCEARGTEVELPTGKEAESPTVRKRFFPHPLAIHALGAGGLLIVILTTARPVPIPAERAESSSAIVIDPSREIPSAPYSPLPVESIPAPKETMKKTDSGPDGVSAGRITAASTPARLTVVRARLCADLDEWRCDPPDRPVPHGPLFFYTQITSTHATTVQHRWYRGNRVHQSLELSVQASPIDGYRTFSRSTMTGESAGDWRVELRTEDGILLHEERFSVR